MDFSRYYILYQAVSTQTWVLYPTPFLTTADARTRAYQMLGSDPGTGVLGPDHIKIVQEVNKGF